MDDRTPSKLTREERNELATLWAIYPLTAAEKTRERELVAKMKLTPEEK